MAGSYAEYSVVPTAKLVKIPSDITFEQAATFMIQGMTAHYLVHSVYPVGPGTKVLVQAAAGGTGSLICQVAKNAGTRADCCCEKYLCKLKGVTLHPNSPGINQEFCSVFC